MMHKGCIKVISRKSGIRSGITFSLSIIPVWWTECKTPRLPEQAGCWPEMLGFEGREHLVEGEFLNLRVITGASQKPLPR
jgi:hypothetical protein